MIWLLRLLSRDQRGAALAELALVIPFFLLLGFGTLEFGYILYQQSMITKGVQEAARFAARNPAVRAGGACPPTNGQWPSIQGAAKNVATRGNPTSGASIMSNFTPSTLSVSVACVSSTGLISSNPSSGSIPVVRVTASVTANSAGFLQLLHLNSLQLTASHEEMGVGL